MRWKITEDQEGELLSLELQDPPTSLLGVWSRVTFQRSTRSVQLKESALLSIAEESLSIPFAEIRSFAFDIVSKDSLVAVTLHIAYNDPQKRDISLPLTLEGDLQSVTRLVLRIARMTMLPQQGDNPYQSAPGGLEFSWYSQHKKDGVVSIYLARAKELIPDATPVPTHGEILKRYMISHPAEGERWEWEDAGRPCSVQLFRERGSIEWRFPHQTSALLRDFLQSPSHPRVARFMPPGLLEELRPYAVRALWFFQSSVHNKSDSIDVKGILKESFINIKGYLGRTPLMIEAALSDDIQDLLRAGALLDERDDHGHTALSFALSRKLRSIVEDVLYQTFQRYRRDLRFLHNEEPLPKVPTEERPESMKKYQARYNPCFTLIERGADVNTKTNQGVTPLMLAAHTGYPRLVRSLLEAGARLEDKTNDGKSALDFARSSPFRRVEVTQLLK